MKIILKKPTVRMTTLACFVKSGYPMKYGNRFSLGEGKPTIDYIPDDINGGGYPVLNMNCENFEYLNETLNLENLEVELIGNNIKIIDSRIPKDFLKN